MDKQTTNGKNKTAIPKELLDQLIAFNGGTEGLTGPEGLLQQLTGALVSRALDGELKHQDRREIKRKGGMKWLIHVRPGVELRISIAGRNRC